METLIQKLTTYFDKDPNNGEESASLTYSQISLIIKTSAHKFRDQQPPIVENTD